MPLNPKLQKFTTASQVLTSFNYTDVAEGTGILTLYGYQSESSTGKDYHLTNQSSQFSKQVQMENAGDPTGTLDLDFDLSPFNLPKRIEGTAIITIGRFWNSVVSGIGTFTGTVSIRKWNGSTETNIVTVTLPDVAATGGGSGQLADIIPLTVPLTNFAAGETLRVTITLTLTRTGGSGAMVVVLGMDPLNRDGVYYSPAGDDTLTSQMKAVIPFKLDV